jgi:hypothetical protein
VIQLILGPNVLRECEEIVRRKAPASLPKLAYLLELGRVEICLKPQDDLVDQAYTMVKYQPDAHVLAEALGADPDYLVTHDKEHFLKPQQDSMLAFQIGTPGDLIQALEEEFTST